MKKMIFALSLILGSQAFAADQFNFHNLGFSPAGYTFAFAQSAVQDGSGFPVAQVHIVNVAKNTIVATEKVMIQDESSYDAQDALNLAIKNSKSKFKKFAITPNTNRGQIIAFEQLSEQNGVFLVNGKKFELNLAEKDAGNTNPDDYWCNDYGSKMMKLTLSQLDKGQEKTIVLQEDQKQPKSRYCSFNYTIANAIRLGKSLVVVLSYQTPGFEGPNSEYMVVTGNLP
ncbi:DUF2259 domain-containing protein [Bdellovibrio sp. HCB337]|uniref:DUF2259 domain-containing protein n=1 Tax=Bdellovibrio sp. HCB337 TaxID=3394358 RepID=UPI0039A65D7D